MNQKDQKTLVVAGVLIVVSVVAGSIASKIQDRNHAKRMKALADHRKQMEQLSENTNTVLNYLDRQLETAKFWDIVTRPES
ncbi:MAG TPA: hypothetical protein VIJ87_06800 [Pyrinomonadaceae bacterium]